MSLITVISLSFIGVIMVAAWPTCRTYRAIFWLIGSMVTVPWLAWLYWMPRAMCYHATIHNRKKLQRRAVREQIIRRQLMTAEKERMRQRLASITFWEDRTLIGSPTEQIIAPQVLDFLRSSYPEILVEPS